MKKIIAYSLMLSSLLVPFTVYRNVRTVSAQSWATLSAPISGPTATPTRVPTPTATPTPRPVINRPPVIISQMFYFQKLNKGFVFNIPVVDREGDSITAKVDGNFKNQAVAWCGQGPYGFACYFSGLFKQTGVYPFKIQAIDSHGAKSIATGAIIVTR